MKALDYEGKNHDPRDRRAPPQYRRDPIRDRGGEKF
jgi:hypothetical protein